MTTSLEIKNMPLNFNPYNHGSKCSLFCQRAHSSSYVLRGPVSKLQPQLCLSLASLDGESPPVLEAPSKFDSISFRSFSSWSLCNSEVTHFLTGTWRGKARSLVLRNVCLTALTPGLPRTLLTELPNIYNIYKHISAHTQAECCSCTDSLLVTVGRFQIVLMRH